MKPFLFKKYISPIIKLLTITVITLAFIVGVYFILKSTGWIGKFNNIQELKTLILSAGFWSYFVFVVLQFLQVTILPLPAMVTTIVGVIIFNPFITFVLSTLSIIAGSIFAFLLGKFFGIKLLNWAIGKQQLQNLQRKMEKGKFVFFLMMLFPLFPDDILCLLAGVMGINFKFFLLTNLITRPIGIFCICFISTGIVIPFHSWGLIVWAIILIFIATLFVLAIKYKSKLENLPFIKILK